MANWVSISKMVSLGYGSRGTIYQHIAKGQFKCGNPGGGKWLIDLDSYELWLQQKQKPHRRHYERRKQYGREKGRRES